METLETLKPSQKTNASHQLQRETEAARILRDQIAALADGDEEVVRDTLEGVTDLHELIAAVVDEIAHDTASVAGIKGHIKNMEARRARMEARIESRRAAILNAMAIGEIKKLELPIATLSRRNTAPQLQTSDEAQIPSQFWKRADPSLDRKALLDALKGGQIVPGAELSNGGETLSVKWS